MSKELDFATSLAKQAGKIIRQNFKLGMEKQIKADLSPVTETDLAINKLVLETIRKEFPDHSILAEEGSDLKDEAEFVWVCDPVDGTIPFSRGIPTCVFSLALTQNGKSILAVIYEAFNDRLFSAEQNKGAFLNGQPIQVSSKNALDGCMVGYEIWKGLKHQFIKNIFPDFIEANVKTINLKSTINMGSLVACGAIDASLYGDEKAHDAAAVKIIVEEAGGKVTDLFGNQQRYDRPVKGFVASNGILHDQILGIIKKHTIDSN